jgi:hypothetical protein
VGIEHPPASERTATLQATLAKIEAEVKANRSEELAASGSLQSRLDSMLVIVRQTAAELSGSFSTFRDDVYTLKVNALAPEDREILTRQIQVLEETKRLPLVEQQCDELLSEVRSVSSEIAKHCQQICTIREDVIDRRKKLVDSLNNQLEGVKLVFQPYANQTSRTKFRDRYGTEGAHLVDYMQGFGKNTSYENLAESFRNLASIERDQEGWNLNRAIFDVKFLEMLDVIDDDDLEIALKVGKAGFVAIQNLSAGQRCVAVFPLLLRNTKGPLVIDQPEDNLDNRYIAYIIGPDLLERKSNQQFLVTSHNANLVVLTDADLIIHIDSDGAQASFPSAGFLSCSSSEIRKSVLDVLDGGEAALNARQKKYGTQKGKDS